MRLKVCATSFTIWWQMYDLASFTFLHSCMHDIFMGCSGKIYVVILYFQPYFGSRVNFDFRNVLLVYGSKCKSVHRNLNYNVTIIGLRLCLIWWSRKQNCQFLCDEFPMHPRHFLHRTSNFRNLLPSKFHSSCLLIVWEVCNNQHRPHKFRAIFDIFVACDPWFQWVPKITTGTINILYEYI